MARVSVLALICLIVVAHIFLWRSDMELEQKITFTALNTIAWTIVLAPVFLIDRWLESVQRRNKERNDAQHPDH